MRSRNPLFEDAVVDCVASGRPPTIQELFQVARRIWAEGAANRSVFRWDDVSASDPEKLLALRAAQAALLGSSADDGAGRR